MAGPRANWKGYLKVAELTCHVALYTGASTAERTTFHTINTATGNRVRREYIDEKTKKPVERDDQVKGYETDSGDFLIIEPDEIAAVMPQSDKILAIESFIPCSQIDTVYFDKPYYLAPADEVAEKAFAVIRQGMEAKSVAALATAVLFRRSRTLLIRPHGAGMIANTLNYDYEVRSAEAAFADVPKKKVSKDMVALAKHIIGTMKGEFDPKKYDDRYENALAELVRAKVEGRPMKAQPKRAEGKVVDLMSALRESARLADKAKGADGKPAAKRGKAAPAEERRKAG
ncbi:MAG: Ku protein [Mesorhizobium sp.]|nr:Ku protein [Mesorhizobium sp.]